jgi:hypothetical protein
MRVDGGGVGFVLWWCRGSVSGSRVLSWWVEAVRLGFILRGASVPFFGFVRARYRALAR